MLQKAQELVILFLELEKVYPASDNQTIFELVNLGQLQRSCIILVLPLSKLVEFFQCFPTDNYLLQQVKTRPLHDLI